MTEQKRYFCEDIKREAVRLSFESGKTVPEIGAELKNIPH